MCSRRACLCQVAVVVEWMPHPEDGLEGLTALAWSARHPALRPLFVFLVALLHAWHLDEARPHRGVTNFCLQVREKRRPEN